MKRNTIQLAAFAALMFIMSTTLSYAGPASGAQAGSGKGHYGDGYAKERNYLSQKLPSWMDLDVELRHRFEYRDNFDFDSNVEDEDAFNLYRSRIGLTLNPAENLYIHYTFQDSRISDDEHLDKVKDKFENWADTKKLYIKYKHLLSLDSIGLEDSSIILGRQPLVYGKERLLGDSQWSNLGQTFDAITFKLNFPFGDVDFFGGKKTDKKIPREHDDLFEGGTKDRVMGYYAKFKDIEGVMLEHYLIQRKTNKSKSFGPSASGELDEYTIGGRIYGPMPIKNFDFDIEAAYQTGDMDELDISAWMAVVMFGYNFDHEWKPRLEAEFTYAQGDADKKDGTRSTFDNLYPNNHDKYGFMDRVALQNVNIYSLKGSVKPTEKLKLESGLHFIFLDTTNDYLYDANVKKVRSVSGSGFSRHVGNELDLAASYDLTSYANFLLGYSYFWAGEYLDDTGNQDDAEFAYVQTTLAF